MFFKGLGILDGDEWVSSTAVILPCATDYYLLIQAVISVEVLYLLFYAVTCY